MEKQLPAWFLPTICAGIIFLILIMFSPTSLLNSTIIPKPAAKSTAPETPAAPQAVELSLPKELNLTKGETKTISASLDTHNKEVSAIELHLKFDPDIIRISKIQPGEFFEKTTVLQKTINNKKGEAIIVAGGLKAKSGNGEVAKITLTAIASGETTLSVRDSKIAAVGEKSNVLGNTTNTLIIIK